MTFHIFSINKRLMLMCILSGIILLTLISCSARATSNIDNVTANTIIEENNPAILKEDIVTKSDSSKEQKDEPEIQKATDKNEASNPSIGKEFIFSEALSQNSAIASGRLPETGQPVLITLVDTAAAELTNTLLDHLEADKLASNKTDSNITGSNLNPVVINVTNATEVVNKTVNTNESHLESKPEIIVRAVPQEKEDTRIIDEAKQEANKTETLTDKDVNDTKSTEGDVNATSVPPPQVQEEIPSFAEWAQKQLEEEKNKDNTVNRSLQSTQSNGVSNTNLKIRSKNYASPDCGAKIVAVNPEAGSASYILTPNKDEYMLNTCNSRIWFVVELCEAIQAKKVDLANFELFSSTPKNFSVFVSDRFPTREWANVGQFIAKDEKDVQTFNLHPHLFGKFVKVEIQSYYGSEHYCPISLFRVYGTSEFEVFETENSPHSQSSHPTDEDDDDDILEDLNITEKEDQSRNLFGSARDAVLSIVKKAAQVLGKGGDVKNSTELLQIENPKSNRCKTPSHIIVCDNCSNSLFTDVFNLMSCDGNEINTMVQIPIIRDTLCNTDICQNFGLDFKSRRTSLVTPRISAYITSFLFPSYIAALCNVLAIIEKKVVLNTSYELELNATTNLTIDKKAQSAITDENINELIQKPFKTCNDKSDPQCKNDPEKSVEVDLKEPNAKNILEKDGDDVSKLKPKVVEGDTDTKQPVAGSTGISTDKPSQLETKVNEPKTEQDSDAKNKETTQESQKHPVEVDAQQKNESATQDNDKKDSKPAPGSSVSQSVINKTVDNVETKNNSGDAAVDDSNIKISSQDQISLDNLLKELEQASTDSGASQTTGSMPPSQGQKESVFLRLSNRIKALERNMSLSGQYLEELSKRYKKQMEEMQKTFEKTLGSVSEETKKAEDRDNKYTEDMKLLQKQIVDLSASVNLLVAERDSWFGTLSLPKIILSQLIITVLVIYLIKRYGQQPKPPTMPERKYSKVKNGNKNDKGKVRRKSSEVPVAVTEHDIKIKKRRPSEEALHITRTATDMRENMLKVEKKKRKRKSPIRSFSIAAPPEPSFQNDWAVLDLSMKTLNTPIVLDEPEFLVPEMDPKDFHTDGDLVPNILNQGSIKNEFTKTNGSVLEKKKSDSNKKTEKSRRLSSPAFIKAAMGRSSTRSADSPPIHRSLSPVVGSNRAVLPVDREVRSEERIIKKEPESPQLSTWSSVGEMSDASGSIKTEADGDKKKRSKRSFRNIFKKVF